ncbi:carboxypeptidase-like regulatory domain-containing protein [Hymenobacter koreensis]|uniref:carboxypeptidase-like regulatory domain-containing protein n=1 Tax=Hymenobacter koreensis TaxID=1084523 RepID=UPI0031F1776A
MSLTACDTETPSPTGTTDPAGPKPEPHTVTGIVVDTNGQPMAGVKVRADNSTLYGSAEVTTGADGRYTLPRLEIGGWKVYAWKEVSYKGHVYQLRMGMNTVADYNAFSPGESGAVKNFKWLLSGTIPDRPQQAHSSSGYFGGALRFANMDQNFAFIPRGTEVTITFTPVAGAKHFDGSAAQVIRKTFTIGESSQINYWLPDIPQAEYRITAESSLNGVRRTVLLTESLSRGFAPAIENFYFLPASRSYESGLLGPENTPFFMQQQQ